MRILHVDKFLRRAGGASAYMLDLADLQRDRGNSVEFFAMADPENLPATYEGSFPSHVELEPPPPGIAAKASAFARMVWSREARKGMEHVIEDFVPDVVHVHNIYHQLSPSILASVAARGIPIVMTAHDYKLVCPTYHFTDTKGPCEACLGGNFLNAPLRRCRNGSVSASLALAAETAIHRWTGAYGPVGRFIAPSRFLADRLRAGGVFADRVRHVPNFFDPGSYPPRSGAGDGVVYVGRLSHEKGVDILIDACALLDGVKLTIVGDGPERGALEAHAARTNPGLVRFVGRVDKVEVSKHLVAARAFALPSRCYENSPLSTLEALGSSVPAVVTSLGGSPEQIRDGIDGAIADPEPEAFATALRPILGDADLSVMMGRAGREHVLADYHSEAHLDRIAEVYTEAGAPTS